MAYTHTSLGQMKVQLSKRLGDPNKIFWVDNELGILLTESLRTFGLSSGFWRVRGTLPSNSSLAFYDICTNLTSGFEQVLSYTVTDRDLIRAIQYHLLESVASQATWNGTEQFTLADLTNAIHNRANQFLSDTGCVVNRSLLNVLAPPIGREELSQSVIDVRRAAWIGAPPENYYVTLWREDERLLTAADQTWSVNAGTPANYSIMAPPPLQLQLAPPPLTSGQLEILTVDSVPALDPATSATIIGIPDDLTPGVKWGALADLLGIDGAASDPPRAEFCEQMYGLYVQMGRLLPVVIHAEINGMPLIPCTLQEIESSTPNWQNIQGQPTDIATCSANMIALNPVPSGTFSVTLDVVRKTPTLVNDSSQIQIGREQVDMILDYAEHLALFKAQGAEWRATFKQAANFMQQSLTYNQRISAAARAALSASFQSQKEKVVIPRRLETSMGIGAMKS